MRVNVELDIKVSGMTDEEIKENAGGIIADSFAFGYDPKVKIVVGRVSTKESDNERISGKEAVSRLFG